MRWSGTIRPGTVYNDMCSHYDLMPTFGSQAQLMITGDHHPWLPPAERADANCSRHRR